MALKSFVLVDEISNLSDARYCAGMGVDVLGFHFNNETDDNKFTEISEWVAGVDFSASFNEESEANIRDRLTRHTLSYLMIEDRSILDEIQHFDKPIILKLSIDTKSDLEALAQILSETSELVKYFYLTCEIEELQADAVIVATSLAKQHPVLLDFGFEIGSVERFIDESGVQGIVLKGSEEEQAGFKDYGYIMDILEEIEAD